MRASPEGGEPQGGGEHKSAGSEKRYMDVPNANLRMEFARKPHQGKPQGGGEHLRRAEAS